MASTGPPGAGGASNNTFVPPQAQQSTTPVVPPGPTATSTTTATNQNLNQIVTDYLLKKGYRRTEETFRQEVKDIDESGKPRGSNESSNSKFLPAGKYLSAFKHLARWIDNGIDLYKFELSKVLWPLFVYSYLRLVSQGSYAHAEDLIEQTRSRFEKMYPDELKGLATVTLSLHVKESPVAKAYLENQYIIPISKSLTGHLFHFLERDLDQCGAVVLDIIQANCRLDSVDRGPIEPFSFDAIYRRARQLDFTEIEIEEGIPGMTNRGGLARNTLDSMPGVKLGTLPMESDLRGDLVPELEEEDRLHPPKEGFRSLVDEFNAMHPIKKEAGDSPQRSDIPYPPSRARDVVMEMQKVRENRDRFRIEGRTGGVGPGVSVCIHTFHNHLGSISCMDFSKDQELVAVGTTESYIRVWSLDGKALKSRLPPEKDRKVNNRKLIGHSAPVYTVAFSDAIANLDRNIYDGDPQPETDTKLLLSCSADGQVRLWSLEVWSCLCIYKGHDGPVGSLAWSPHGHYFVTGGWDKTVRVWSQDHASAQRLLVGHDTAISVVAWHPNGAYVFSASDETDKSIRMWSVVSGDCVRIFNGHTEYISALECAPSGKILASADIGGNIILWDIEKGSRIKRCRGHGRGGIWSLGFSVESSVLVSGGQDNTVRVWDVDMPSDGNRHANQQDGDSTIVAAGGQADGKQTGQATQPSSGAGGSTGKRKGKEVMITPDQISAFPTKKTPVMKVQFTRMNLVIAGGCYQPETQDANR
ncbi:WD40 repeat-like protein [Hypoxylon rubiginosum]|uniref:WD40 repeat-like protein n=1 Tax=Hypoxylon rubiginosum TaxID=110542 RepID=A0ACB9Z1T3_9PEZI|nr:WD40 repeat-like protein [Hypoxylon rubiginosum]